MHAEAHGQDKVAPELAGLDDGSPAVSPGELAACEGQQRQHWIFGYGSILLESSRRSTLVAHSQAEPPPAALVELSAAAGFVREWNFQAPSGFTAVGLRRVSGAPMPVCGVLFEASVALARFDAREAGYERIELRADQLAVLGGDGAPAAVALRSGDVGRHRFWTYVPRTASAASDEHPICQTYVDTCLLGCLERGGAALAARWVRTTSSWSDYWLNDAPMSRRPWLHRPRCRDRSRANQLASSG